MVFFFYATFFMPPPKNSRFFMPPCFMPPPEIFMPPFLCHPPVLKSLCHPFVCHLNYFYVSKKKLKFTKVYRHFKHNFCIASHFFYASPFYATLKNIEIFMPPPFYATLKILMPPFLCHPGGGIKKRGGGIKKNQCAGPGSKSA